jgi:2-C-methyl-D-erythritol 2,4-cyclodiphosphate synthase
MARVGFGYDVHAFALGRPLVLGGVVIEHARGLAGHSDADVLLHAVCDALLGAAALGDIGRYFPDSDAAYEGISSLLLLERTMGLVDEAGFRIGNIDATIVAERPKLVPHIEAMIANIAGAVGASNRQINVKATTTEGLGFAGRQEGIGAYAVALLEEK